MSKTTRESITHTNTDIYIFPDADLIFCIVSAATITFSVDLLSFNS